MQNLFVINKFLLGLTVTDRSDTNTATDSTETITVNNSIGTITVSNSYETITVNDCKINNTYPDTIFIKLNNIADIITVMYRNLSKTVPTSQSYERKSAYSTSWSVWLIGQIPREKKKKKKEEEKKGKKNRKTRKKKEN